MERGWLSCMEEAQAANFSLTFDLLTRIVHKAEFQTLSRLVNNATFEGINFLLPLTVQHHDITQNSTQTLEPYKNIYWYYSSHDYHQPPLKKVTSRMKRIK